MHRTLSAHSALTYAPLQLRGISCSICSKLAKKLLECALPITVPAQTNPFDAFLAAADSCLTTAWDRVLYECVDGERTRCVRSMCAHYATHAFGS